MKLEIGIPNYPAKGVPDIMRASLRGRKPDKGVPLLVASANKMAELHGTLPNVRGCPRYVAFDAKKEEVWLHPVPDGKYILDIVPAKSSHTLGLPKKAAA